MIGRIFRCAILSIVVDLQMNPDREDCWILFVNNQYRVRFV